MSDTKGKPGEKWLRVNDDQRRCIDIVPKHTAHTIGDLNCWCKPAIEFVPRDGDQDPVVLIKHNLPPHSFVMGDLKRDVLEFQDDMDEFEVEQAMSDDHACCEFCGTIETDENLNERCDGPSYVTATYFGDPCDDPDCECKGYTECDR